MEIGSQGSDPSRLRRRCRRLQEQPTELCGVVGQQQQVCRQWLLEADLLQFERQAVTNASAKTSER